MPEASPDPLPPRPQPPSPAPTPAPASSPHPAPAPQRSVQPRRFGLIAIIVFFAFIVAVVIATVLLSGGEGSQEILANQFGIPAADLRSVIFTFIEVVYGIAALVAVVYMLVGGFRAATSLGDAREAQRGRRTLFSALGVIVFLFGSFVVFYRLLGAPQQSAPAPKASISVEPAERGQVPFRVVFTVTSSYPQEASYQWDFGDGTVQTVPSPGTVAHTFDKPSGEKPYAVKLEVVQGGKTVDRFTRSITAEKSQAVASITTAPGDPTGPAPFTVEFDATLSKPGPGAGPTLTYLWDFGEPVDPAAKPEKQLAHMSHKFVREGSYVVRLTVTDDQGQTDTTTADVTVTATKTDPVARITTSPAMKDSDPNDVDPKNPDNLPVVSGIAPLLVTFSAASSESPNGRITSYGWSYGDGSGSDSGRAASHTFSTIGSFVTELTITDVDGKTGKARVLVRVLPLVKAPTARIDSIPPANGSSLIGNAPYKVTLDGSGSTDESGHVVAYSWDFGDTATKVEGDHVEHTYTRPGEYFIKLVVTNDSGLSSKPATLQIKVNPGVAGDPKARIQTDPPVPTGTVPLVVQFDGSASVAPNSTIVNYAWDFGDQSPTVNSGAKVTHIYKLAGLYTVRLTTTSADGRSAQVTATVSAQEPPPAARIEVNRTVTTTGTPIVFRGDSSRGNIQNWFWDFGDGLSENGRQISHTFTTPGFYTVKLIVTDVNNQTDQTTIKVEVD